MLQVILWLAVVASGALTATPMLLLAASTTTSSGPTATASDPPSVGLNNPQAGWLPSGYMWFIVVQSVVALVGRDPDT